MTTLSAGNIQRCVPSASRCAHRRVIIEPVALLATVLAFAAPAVRARAAQSIATVTIVSGSVEILRADGKTEPARTDASLGPGDGVRTAANGKVELHLSDGSLLRLAENTQVRLTSDGENRGLFVSAGRIWARIMRALGRSKFEVTTPAAVAGVRGTILRVAVDESGAAEFAVDEGEVEVYKGPRRARLRAMMALRAGPGAWQPRRFDPARRKPWEFWTDPLVIQRLAAVRAQGQRYMAEGARIRREIEALHEALAVDFRAARRVADRAEHWRQRVAATARDVQRLQQQRAALDKQAADLPPRVLAQRRAELYKEGARLGEAASELARELQEINAAIERGRAARQKHLQALDEHIAQLKQHVKKRKDWARLIAKTGAIRRVDPHWDRFRPTYQECQRAHRGLQDAEQACYRLVNGERPRAKP
ncbi:MAG: FecR domain-containing protein, partial [Armatimonadota bacterium]